MSKIKIIEKIYQELEIMPELHNAEVLDLRISLKELDKIIDIVQKYS